MCIHAKREIDSTTGTPPDILPTSLLTFDSAFERWCKLSQAYKVPSDVIVMMFINDFVESSNEAVEVITEMLTPEVYIS